MALTERIAILEASAGTSCTEHPDMGFDLADYVGRVQPVAVEDLDFEAFRDRPLAPEALRCLRYMHDVENHTVCYLRDLLVTRAHRDPEITTFLTLWNFEEFWHGEAIARVLRAHGEPAGIDRVGQMRRSLGSKDRAEPLLMWLASAVAPDFVAVHMTWGAINEWSTQAGYARLGAKAKDPVLSELLRRLMRQEGRHIDFYWSEATRRLARSRGAQRLTRFALKKLWTPVGAGVMPQAEVRFLIRYLFGNEGRAAAQRIDRRIDRLPGLDGLGLVDRALRTYGAA